MNLPQLETGSGRCVPSAFAPFAEQSCIVVKLDDLMALVDKLEAQQNAARSIGTKLLAAAIAELTNGEKRRAVAAG